MSEQRNELHLAILQLHSELAQRECASTSVLKACASIGKDLSESLAAGLLTLGGHHAPVEQAMKVWERRNEPLYLQTWNIVPGFGSSWYTGEPDPIFESLHTHLSTETLMGITDLTTMVQAQTDKKLYPNAALYTAIAASIMGYDSKFASSLLVRGRIDQWCLLWHQNYRGLS